METNNKLNFFDVVDFEYKKSKNQSNTFTPYHTRYDVVIKHKYEDKTLTMEYQCNPKYKTPTLKGCLACYISDADAYECCDDDIDYFNKILCFDSVKECLQCFTLCKESYNNILDFCGENGYEWLKKYFENY